MPTRSIRVAGEVHKYLEIAISLLRLMNKPLTPFPTPNYGKVFWPPILSKTKIY